MTDLTLGGVLVWITVLKMTFFTHTFIKTTTLCSAKKIITFYKNKRKEKKNRSEDTQPEVVNIRVTTTQSLLRTFIWFTKQAKWGSGVYSGGNTVLCVHWPRKNHFLKSPVVSCCSAAATCQHPCLLSLVVALSMPKFVPCKLGFTCIVAFSRSYLYCCLSTWRCVGNGDVKQEKWRIKDNQRQCREGRQTFEDNDNWTNK